MAKLPGGEMIGYHVNSVGFWADANVFFFLAEVCMMKFLASGYFKNSI